MARQPTGNPNGRPRKDAATIPAAKDVEAGRSTTADAARQSGASERTIRSRKAELRKAPPSAGKAPPRPDPPPAAPEPDGRRRAILAAVGALLDAQPDLLATDPAELARRMTEPSLPPMPEGADPLAIVGWVETVMAREAVKMGADSAVARRQALALVVAAAKGRAQILAGMPEETETPEVLAGRMVEGLRDAVLSRVTERIEAEEEAA